MDLEKIEKLVNIIEKSSMLEFSIQEGDTKIKNEPQRKCGSSGGTSYCSEDRGTC